MLFSVAGSDICDKSYNVMQCFYKANPEVDL